MTREEIKIAGMTCTACALNIERNLNKMDGISDVYVNYANESAVFSRDDSKISRDAVYTTIESLGFTPIIKRDTKETSLLIQGMT